MPSCCLPTCRFSDPSPQWLHLHEDRLFNRLGTNVSAGSLLASVGFGTSQTLRETQAGRDWVPSIMRLQAPFRAGMSSRHYELRLFVLSARSLPAMDDNGLMDPVLKVIDHPRLA